MRPYSVFLRRHDCRAVWLLRWGNNDLLRGVLRVLLAVMLIGDLAQIGPERLALLLGTVGTKHIKHTKHSFFSCISAALPGYTLGIVFARGVWVMRSKRGIFWYSLGLTLLLLLPMILTVAFFTDQYQKQQLLRQASAADSTLRIEPGAQGIFPLLLVIQQEEPAFLLVRADGPQQTLTLCALPGSLRVNAPAGTTTLADCTLAAGAGRAAQLLCGTVATGESAAPALHYIAATPATWAACAGIATQARQARSSMLEVIRSDYITTARAKGVSEHKVIYGHALPNALIPIVTVAGSNLAHMFGGSLIIEQVFSIPGIGTYMITAVNSRDYPVVEGCVIFLAITFSIMMLLVDLAYAYIDPRIKAQYEGGKGGH